MIHSVQLQYAEREGLQSRLKTPQKWPNQSVQKQPSNQDRKEKDSYWPTIPRLRVCGEFEQHMFHIAAPQGKTRI